MKRYVLLALTCAALPAAAALAQPKKPAPPRPASPLAGQPFKPKLDPPTAAEWRTVDPQNLLVIDSTKGRILVEMIPEVAPQSVARIKELAKEHFYDGLTFHRVVAGFMAQGGDPKGTGEGGSSKPDVPGEFAFRRGATAPYVKLTVDNGLEDGFVKSMVVRGQNSDLAVMTADGKVSGWGLWCPGTAGMARANDPNSANSQFYLMLGFNAGLERKYTPWGRVL
ncbi:MAG: peptidylprolyl isomerase, partial [Caulobacteraceae bacterium]